MPFRLTILFLAALLLVACGDDGGASPTPQGSTPTQGSPTNQPTQPPDGSDQGTWQTLAPMPTARSEVAVAEVNGLIYVVGGFEASGAPSQKVEVYDPATDSWSEATPLPAPRHHTAAVGWEGDLLVIGGYQTGFNDPRDTVYRYDPDTERWTEDQPLLTPLGGHAATIAEGIPVIVGGADQNGRSLATAYFVFFNSVFLPFDSELDAARDHLAVATARIETGGINRDNVFAIGGRVDVDFAENLSAVERSEHFEQWETVASLPTARSGIAAATVDNKIYVFGGEGSEGTFDENEVYDPETDTWSEVTPMPTARHGHGAAVVNGVIYVIGGGPTPGLSVSGANEAFTP